VTAIELRQVDEVLSLYELEPVKDIYVEGTLDKSLLEWFLNKSGRSDVTVYTVDILDISDEVLTRHGLSSPSNRSKVIALSYELTALPKVSAKVLCIVDRDYEDILPQTKLNPFLVFTDFNSIENYVLNSSSLRKFVTIALGNLHTDTDLLLSQLIMILRRIFYIRAANEKLSWSMRWISLRRYLSVARDRLTFNERTFVRALLLSNGRSGQQATFDKAVATIETESPNEDRLVIRGHDFIEVLHLVAKRLRPNRKYQDIHFFRGAFLASLEESDLSKHQLFKNILTL